MVLAVGIGCWKLDATTQPWALQGRQESLAIPILHVGGDHDIIFPVENWYALNQQLPTLQLLTFPLAGHGPHHEHPEAAAEHIATFVRSAK